MSTRREVWGYTVWGAMGVVIAVPELWAALGGKSVEWPTISGTVGYLEYWHTWVALIVVGILVWAAAGITVLLIHLALYPWPAVIPDLQDLHTSYSHHHHAVKKHEQPLPGAP